MTAGFIIGELLLCLFYFLFFYFTLCSLYYILELLVLFCSLSLFLFFCLFIFSSSPSVPGNPFIVQTTPIPPTRNSTTADYTTLHPGIIQSIQSAQSLSRVQFLHYRQGSVECSIWGSVSPTRETFSRVVSLIAKPQSLTLHLLLTLAAIHLTFCPSKTDKRIKETRKDKGQGRQKET